MPTLMCWIHMCRLRGCISSANLFLFFLLSLFSAQQQHRSIAFRCRGSLSFSLSLSMWTLSWNEGLAAIATIWWGRRGYLKEFSCCSRSPSASHQSSTRQRHTCEDEFRRLSFHVPLAVDSLPVFCASTGTFYSTCKNRRRFSSTTQTRLSSLVNN